MKAIKLKKWLHFILEPLLQRWQRRKETLFHLDQPQEIPVEMSFLISGWIVSRTEISRVQIAAAPEIPLEFIERPDVVRAYPSYQYVKGFKGIANKAVIAGNTLTFCYVLSARKLFHTVTFKEKTLPPSHPQPERTFIYLDYLRKPSTENPAIFRGWMISHEPILEMWLPHDRHNTIRFFEQSKVGYFYSSYPFSTGFTGYIDRSFIEDKLVKIDSLDYRTPSGEFSYTFPIKNPYPLTTERKESKLKQIAAHLACPHCKTPFTKKQVFKPQFSCKKCRSDYEFDGHRFNFLTTALKEQFKVVDTTNVSANEYDNDPTIISFIKQYASGLILDCGAGSRPFDYPQVVNFEIVPYTSTDVIGVAEKLPFQDGTFDAVISIAVLEHVSNPFACASEMARVLKKGGTLYCVVPFLQPLHGYPNHFYNMTSQGLQNLFDQHLDIVHAEIPPAGSPIWTLTWYLSSWAAGLDEATRQSFLNLRIADLFGNPMSYLPQEFVKNLSPEKNAELACNTMIIAKKRN